MTDADDETNESVELDSFERELHDELAPGKGVRGGEIESFEGAVDIGPFMVDEQIGRGGMGTVFRGEHRELGVPVAVKVLTESTDADQRSRFHEEVQAQAGLLHPGTAYLFEYGELDSRVEEQSGGLLEAGSPFVVMELADGGTVREAMPVSTWDEVRRLLRQTLDALAHSHARNVIHRDLKPENLLVFGSDPPGVLDGHVKLADFGIAHAMGGEAGRDTDALSSPIGTPLYMAPEQFGGHWREYGPWTDLYSLGCITWELVCGRPPFEGRDKNFVDMAVLHGEAERPAFEPRIPVPEGLEAWLGRCLARSPERRFQRAADALWHLPRGRPEPAEPPEEVDRRSEDPSGPVQTRAPTLEATVRLDDRDESGTERPEGDRSTSSTRGETGGSDGSSDAGSHLAELRDVERPPVPRSWRRGGIDRLPAPLVGAGLGLFGLREPPFVDRTPERDGIWEALRRVAAGEGPEVVAIEGEAGTGKSRLAEWMATRAHEVGAARVVRATHTAEGGRTQGLRGALERTFRTAKLERREVFERLRDSLPRDEEFGEAGREGDARPLTEYLRPTEQDTGKVDGPAYQFSSADQRHGLVLRTLRSLSARRPVVLWLDDLQWGREALGVLEQLRDRPDDDFDLLVLATIRSDLVRDAPDVRERLEALQSSKSWLRLPLEPLSVDDQRDLLEGLLPLEDRLAGRLAERTEGHPLFAMQLLGHWIESDALEVASEGFRIPEGRDVELPGDIHELWTERISRLLDRFAPDIRSQVLPALELAAALGREIDGTEWAFLRRESDVAIPAALVDRLVESGLAERTSGGWSFAHGLLVESLERVARERGRWQQHHHRCAEALGALYADHPERAAERRADHWVEAGEPASALQPLEVAVRWYWEAGDPASQKRVLEWRDDLLDRLDAPDTDPRRVENDLELLQARYPLGADAESVLESLEEVRQRAEALDSDRLSAKAWRVEARYRRVVDDLAGANRAAERAVRRARRSGDTTERCAALYRSGWTEYLRGNFDAAEERFREAHVVADRGGDRHRELLTQRDLALVALTRGEYERATELFEDVLRESRDAGYRALEARCLNGLGDIARFRGSAEAARSNYTEFAEIVRELNQPVNAAIARANLAQVELMVGRVEAAAQKLREAERQLRELSRDPESFDVLRVVRLTVAAASADWSRFDEIFEEYASDARETLELVRDYPWLFERAGDYAAEADDRERSRRAWRVAGTLWEELGDDAAVARLEEKLDSVP